MRHGDRIDPSVPPRSDLGRGLCLAETPYPRRRELPLICNAQAGHDGPHAAYAGPGNLVHSWPKAGGQDG